MKTYRQFVSEAKKAPGQTMAQRHDDMFYGTEKSPPVGLIKFTSAVRKDWKSGDMSFGRLEQVFRSAFFIFMKGHGTDPSGKNYKHFNTIRDEFTKKYPEIDRILRFGKSGHKLNTGMGNVSPKEIVKALDTVLVFAKKDMPALVKAGKIPAGFDPLGEQDDEDDTKVAKPAKARKAEKPLFTHLHHPKGPAVVTGKGKTVKIHGTERAARKHADGKGNNDKVGPETKTDGKNRKPGTTWKTANGNYGAKNRKGELEYFSPRIDRDAALKARDWAKS